MALINWPTPSTREASWEQLRTSTNNSTKMEKRRVKLNKKRKKKKMKMETRYPKRRPPRVAGLDNSRVELQPPIRDSRLPRRLEMALRRLAIWERKSVECSDEHRGQRFECNQPIIP